MASYSLCNVNKIKCAGIWLSLQLFQPKTVEMQSIGTLQPHEPKPVEVDMVVPNRT